MTLIEALKKAREYVERERDEYSELTWDEERQDIDSVATVAMMDAEELLRAIDELLSEETA